MSDNREIMEMVMTDPEFHWLLRTGFNAYTVYVTMMHVIIHDSTLDFDQDNPRKKFHKISVLKIYLIFVGNLFDSGDTGLSDSHGYYRSSRLHQH